ncbi:MAG: hypothetical protein IT290_05320 [Deltaproteobacteria bacterium]|nr:hypothetical protein [Deltaproteobacteria bacterium]
MEQQESAETTHTFPNDEPELEENLRSNEQNLLINHDASVDVKILEPNECPSHHATNRSIDDLKSLQ